MSDNGKIAWTTERRKLADLKPWPRNPRQIKSDQAKRLVDSFAQFGQVETIAVGPGDEVYNGHQRLLVLEDEYGEDYEVDVRVSSRALTEKEREKLTVYLHKGAAGEWDFDVLANEFEITDLLDWGFKGYELGFVGDPNDPNAEWKGMPEYDEQNLSAFRTIKVHFRNEQDIKDFEELIGYKISLKNFIWYPRAEILHQDLVIENDES